MEKESVRIVQCENKFCEEDFVYKISEAKERQPWEFLVCPHCNFNNGIPIENKERFEEWKELQTDKAMSQSDLNEIGELYDQPEVQL